MSARDELAHLLFITDNSGARDVEAEWRAAGGKQLIYIYAMADALLAVGYSKPRTITTAKELDALPVGSVIRTSGIDFQTEARVAVKTGFWMNESEWEVADAEDFCLDSEELDDLPATVLHEPVTS